MTRKKKAWNISTLCAESRLRINEQGNEFIQELKRCGWHGDFVCRCVYLYICVYVHIMYVYIWLYKSNFVIRFFRHCNQTCGIFEYVYLVTVLYLHLEYESLTFSMFCWWNVWNKKIIIMYKHILKRVTKYWNFITFSSLYLNTSLFSKSELYFFFWSNYFNKFMFWFISVILCNCKVSHVWAFYLCLYKPDLP